MNRIHDYDELEDRIVNGANVDLLNDNGVYIGNSHFVTGRDMDWLARTLGEINV